MLAGCCCYKKSLPHQEFEIVPMASMQASGKIIPGGGFTDKNGITWE
jgi:hypothetical protein